MRDRARAKIVERLGRVKKEKQEIMVKTLKKEMGIPDPEVVCYNCLGRGHRFMECVVMCGRCGRDGHRTVYCG